MGLIIFHAAAIAPLTAPTRAIVALSANLNSIAVKQTEISQ